MPDPSTELEELRRRVEEQSQRIDELQDALHTLSVAVQYRQEEPYLAFLAEHGIAGRRRIALMTVSYYTSDAADDRTSVDLGGRRIIKKKKCYVLLQTFLSRPTSNFFSVNLLCILLILAP